MIAAPIVVIAMAVKGFDLILKQMHPMELYVSDRLKMIWKNFASRKEKRK